MLTASYQPRARTVWIPLRTSIEICRLGEGHSLCPWECRLSVGKPFPRRNVLSTSIWLYLEDTNFHNRKAEDQYFGWNWRVLHSNPDNLHTTNMYHQVTTKINTLGKWKDDLLRTNELMSYPLVWLCNRLLYTSRQSTKVHFKATIWRNKS